MATIKVGISDQDAFTLPDLRARRRLLDRGAAAGLDHSRSATTSASTAARALTA